MTKRILRPFILLLALLLVLTSLAGCTKELGALGYFFTPKPATTVTGGTAGGTQPTSGILMYYDERLEISGSLLSLDDQVSQDELLIDVVSEDTEKGTTTIRATGVGSAKLTLLRSGVETVVDITVRPAPLSLFLVLGEGEALGSSSAASYPVKTSDGLAYYTVGYTAANMPVTDKNAASCIPESLTGEGVYAADGTRLVCPLNSLTASGEGNYAGFVSSFAYKWVEQTGERVWMLNAGREGSHITDWKSTGSCYASAVALFRAASDLLDREIAAGHYTLSRLGYLFSQGESDSAMNASVYLEAMREMHTSLRKDISYTDKDGKTVSLGFGGMIACRASRIASDIALRMNGPRAAQHYVANSVESDFADLYMLANAIDYWNSNEGVVSYFSRYNARNYRNFYGYAVPSSLGELVEGNGAYTEAALNELGCQAAETLLYVTGKWKNTGDADIRLLAADGVGTVSESLRTPYGVSYFSAVPVVNPIRLAKKYAPTLVIEGVGDTPIHTYYVHESPVGKQVSLELRANGVLLQSFKTTVRYNLTFAFTDSLPLVSRVDGVLRFNGYSGYWTCGYADQNSGAYKPYSAIEAKTGWLYDGNNLWGGHGGVYATSGWKFGPVNNWDSAYAFTAPQDGKISFSFSGVRPPINSYYLGVFLNGKMVWPTANAATDNDAAFYTVTKTTTAETLSDAAATTVITVKKGDVLTFVCRRQGNATAEGAAYPVVKYLD